MRVIKQMVIISILLMGNFTFAKLINLPNLHCKTIEDHQFIEEVVIENDQGSYKLGIPQLKKEYYLGEGHKLNTSTSIEVYEFKHFPSRGSTNLYELVLVKSVEEVVDFPSKAPVKNCPKHSRAPCLNSIISTVELSSKASSVSCPKHPRESCFDEIQLNKKHKYNLTLASNGSVYEFSCQE